MASNQLLGLFRDIVSTTNAIAQLRQLGVTDDQVTVIPVCPTEPEMLTRPSPKGRLKADRLAWRDSGHLRWSRSDCWAVLTLSHDTRGSTSSACPPFIIIIFEVMMLGVMAAAFLGFCARQSVSDVRSPGVRRANYSRWT